VVQVTADIPVVAGVQAAGKVSDGENDEFFDAKESPGRSDNDPIPPEDSLLLALILALMDTEATTTPTSKPAKRRSPKQKAAIETPTPNDANDNDFAAGYGSDGETRTENSTPSKTAAKKSRTSRKAKDNANGEPAVKNQKTSKAAKSTKTASPKTASPKDFTGQLLAAASPVKKEAIKIEAGSESETEIEEKQKMKEDADAEHDEAGDQGSLFEEAMHGTD
ncbi:MAG: hypothetical protein Q9192_006851, partial [Flavoplaca navasiana]